MTTPSEQEHGLFWGPKLFQDVPKKFPLIEHMLYIRDTAFISAKPGGGKSVLLLQLIANLTTGQPFLDSFRVTKPCTVLYIQTEGDRGETIGRIKSIEKTIAFDHTKWVHANLQGLMLNVEKEFRAFQSLIEKPDMPYDVIIIDPLYTTVKGSLISDEVATDWIRMVRGLKERNNSTVIITHHESGKDTYAVDGHRIEKDARDLMGSTYWSAFASVNYKLSGDAKSGFKLVRGKERNPHLVDSIHMRMIQPDPLCFVIADKDSSISEMQIMKFLSDSNGSIGVGDIVEKTGLSRATVYRVLRDLVTKEKVEKKEEGRNIFYCVKEKISDSGGGPK